LESYIIDLALNVRAIIILLFVYQLAGILCISYMRTILAYRHTFITFPIPIHYPNTYISSNLD